VGCLAWRRVVPHTPASERLLIRADHAWTRGRKLCALVKRSGALVGRTFQRIRTSLYARFVSGSICASCKYARREYPAMRPRHFPSVSFRSNAQEHHFDRPNAKRKKSHLRVQCICIQAKGREWGAATERHRSIQRFSLSRINRDGHTPWCCAAIRFPHLSPQSFLASTPPPPSR